MRTGFHEFIGELLHLATSIGSEESVGGQRITPPQHTSSHSASFFSCSSASCARSCASSSAGTDTAASWARKSSICCRCDSSVSRAAVSASSALSCSNSNCTSNSSTRAPSSWRSVGGSPATLCWLPVRFAEAASSSAIRSSCLSRWCHALRHETRPWRNNHMPHTRVHTPPAPLVLPVAASRAPAAPELSPHAQLQRLRQSFAEQHQQLGVAGYSDQAVFRAKLLAPRAWHVRFEASAALPAGCG